MILHKALQFFCLHKSFVTRSEDGGGSDGHDPLPLVEGVKNDRPLPHVLGTYFSLISTEFIPSTVFNQFQKQSLFQIYNEIAFFYFTI